MSSPNLLRVGAAENIFVECQDCTGGDIKVYINVMNHPTKTKKLGLGASVTLNSANNFQGFGQITVKESHYPYIFAVSEHFNSSLSLCFSRIRYRQETLVQTPTRSSMCTCKLNSLTDCWRKWYWSPFSLDTSSSRQTRISTPPTARVRQARRHYHQYGSKQLNSN